MPTDTDSSHEYTALVIDSARLLNVLRKEAEAELLNEYLFDTVKENTISFNYMSINHVPYDYVIKIIVGISINGKEKTLTIKQNVGKYLHGYYITDGMVGPKAKQKINKLHEAIVEKITNAVANSIAEEIKDTINKNTYSVIEGITHNTYNI